MAKFQTVEDKKNHMMAEIMAAAAAGKTERAEDLMEKMWELARQDGMDDLAIDLWDGKEIEAEGVEFMIENNGVADPRLAKNRG